MHIIFPHSVQFSEALSSKKWVNYSNVRLFLMSQDIVSTFRPLQFISFHILIHPFHVTLHLIHS